MTTFTPKTVSARRTASSSASCVAGWAEPSETPLNSAQILSATRRLPSLSPSLAPSPLLIQGGVNPENIPIRAKLTPSAMGRKGPGAETNRNVGNKGKSVASPWRGCKQKALRDDGTDSATGSFVSAAGVTCALVTEEKGGVHSDLKKASIENEQG